MTSTRLSTTDLAFVHSHDTGPGVVDQLVLRFDERISFTTLVTLHHRLTQTAWSRAVHTPVIPFARRKWVPATRSSPLHIEPADIPADTVSAWLFERAQAPLNLHSGQAWQLSAAFTTGGGTVLSLIGSHAIADGHTGDIAVAQAISFETPMPPVPQPDTWRDDIADAAAQLRVLGPVLWREASRIARDRTHRGALAAGIRTAVRTSIRPAPVPTSTWRETSAQITVSAADWDRVAQSNGGSANTLFMAMQANLLRTFLDLPDAEPAVLYVAILATRNAANPDSNSFTRVLLPVTSSESNYGDLSALRAKSKAMFAQAPPVGDSNFAAPLGLHDSVVHLLPRAVHAAFASRDYPVRVAVSSNLGELPAEFLRLDGHRPTGCGARAVHQRITADQARTLNAAMLQWCRRIGGTMSVNVQAHLPDSVPQDDVLAHGVLTELRKWGIEGEVV